MMKFGQSILLVIASLTAVTLNAKENYDDWNGIRVQLPGKPQVYLVDQGHRRAIPNKQLESQLFTDVRDIYIDSDTAEIPVGENLPADMHLARCNKEEPVYVIDGKFKRRISGEDALDKYGFNLANIKVDQCEKLKSLSSGYPID